MTAMWGSDVNGVHLAYKVAQLATRRSNAVIVCECGNLGGTTADNRFDFGGYLERFDRACGGDGNWGATEMEVWYRVGS